MIGAIVVCKAVKGFKLKCGAEQQRKFVPHLYSAANANTIQYQCFVSPNWYILNFAGHNHNAIDIDISDNQWKNAAKKLPQINGEMNL